MSKNAAIMAGLASALAVEVKAFGDAKTVETLRGLQEATPRKSGRAQAGWRITSGGPPQQPQAPYRPMSPEEARAALRNRAPHQDAGIGNAVSYLPEIHARRPFIPRVLANVASRGRR